MINVTQDLPVSSIGAHVKPTITSAVTLTAPAGAKRLVFSVETEGVRMTLDGTTTATASVGLLFEPADYPYALDITEGTVISVIAADTGAVINYQWSR